MRPLIVAACLLLLAGCHSDEVELAEVGGRVTLDGKPLPDALVKFTPLAGGRSSSDLTDSDGRYTLVYSARDSGALVGPHKVTISTGDPENPKAKPELVPARYNAKSAEMRDVEPGANEFDLELQSK
jgi:hypothetical protein